MLFGLSKLSLVFSFRIAKSLVCWSNSTVAVLLIFVSGLVCCIFCRASTVNSLSAICFGQHLEPAGTNISFRMKALTRAYWVTTMSFGPGFLHITQFAWLFDVLGMLSVIEGGLAQPDVFILLHGSLGPEVSDLLSCVANDWVSQIYLHFLQRTSSFVVFCKNFFSIIVACWLLILYLSFGVVLLLHRTHGYHFGPVPGMLHISDKNTLNFKRKHFK